MANKFYSESTEVTSTTTIWNSPWGHPTGLGKGGLLDFRGKAYFSIGKESEKALVTAGYSSTFASDITTNGFWKILIQSFNEGHSEGHTITPVVSDTFVAFGTGANPINISITGMLYTMADQDHRLDFLKIYNDAFRGSSLQHNKLTLDFHIKETSMKLLIGGITLAQTSSQEDFTHVAISGVAYGYYVMNYSGDSIGTNNVLSSSADASQASNLADSILSNSEYNSQLNDLGITTADTEIVKKTGNLTVFG